MASSTAAININWSKSFTGRKKIRKSFGRIPEVAEMPNLIEVQRRSYDDFLQMDIPVAKRERRGLQEVLMSAFPISDFSGTRGSRFPRPMNSNSRNTTSRNASNAA